MKKNWLFLFIVLVFNYSSYSQQPFNFISSPSPSAQNGKPATNVNAFTGKLGLSFPFYQYKSSSSTLAFGVSLDYSGGGLNLNQNPSAVGTGWNLNAGGGIRRIIRGLPDDLLRTAPDGVHDRSGYTYSPTIDNTFCPLHYRTVGYYENPDNKIQQDSEPDEFQFSFLGKQGSFVIPKNGVYTNGPQVKTKPQSNLEVSFILGNHAANIKTNITHIIIKDDNGIEYWFSAYETTKTKKSRTIDDGNNNHHYEYDFNDEFYITSWLLTMVKNVNSEEEIDLTYEDYSINSINPKTLTRYSSDKLEFYLDDRNYERGTLKRLKLISVNNGDVIGFEYDATNRCDYLSDKALNKIIVSNSGNTLEYQLNYTYFQGASEIPVTICSSSSEEESLSKWLFLKSIYRNIQSASFKIADFEYIRSTGDVSTAVSDNIIPQRKEAYNQDVWGFYNGNGANGRLRRCGRFTSADMEPIGGICKYPDPLFAAIGSLKRITYPTGSSTTFDYEGNSILNTSGANEVSFGIRVKKIVESDGISSLNDIKKEYKYIDSTQKSSGFTFSLPPFSYQNTMSVYNNASPYLKNYVISSTSTVLPPIAIQGSPVGYSRVEETNNLGSTVSEFSSFNDYAPITNTFTYPFADKDRLYDWDYGLLKKQTIKDLTGNSKKTIQNTYNVINNTLLTGSSYQSMKTAYQKESDVPVYVYSDDPASCNYGFSIWLFRYDTYYPVTGRTELTQTVENNYLTDGSTMENTVQYEYDANKFYLKKVTSYNSVKDKLEKIMFYPHEYGTSSTTYKLVQKGMQSLPVSSLSVLTKTNGNKYITGFEKSEFQQMTDLSIRPLQTLTMKSKSPVSISSTKTTFTPEENYGDATQKLSTDVTFVSYDAEGKTLQTTSKETVSSAIWDNEQKIVVAKANAPVDDIAFSSFETSEKGNWSYTGNGFFEITSPAGKKCYSLTGNTISKSGLTTTTNYIVSYRSKNGSYNVNGTSPFITGVTVNGWTYYKHKVTGINQVSITGSGLIDELRLHPETARMTTITYEPLLGVTSESGTEEEITKYEYDSYGRVVDIKNQFGNVVKVFCYNSAGQLSLCGDAPVFKNSAINQIIFKSSCAAGQGIIYSVPQGRYISFINQDNADAQAANDIKTYGKDYRGTCSNITLYAQLNYENVQYGETTTIADVVVRFFSDENCTHSVDVSSLNINYSIDWTDPSGSHVDNLSSAANGSSIVLGSNVLLQWQDYECDYGYWPCYTYNYYTNYSLTPSSYYQIK